MSDLLTARLARIEALAWARLDPIGPRIERIRALAAARLKALTDYPDEGDGNEFDLPLGRNLARAIREWFDRVWREVHGILKDAASFTKALVDRVSTAILANVKPMTARVGPLLVPDWRHGYDALRDRVTADVGATFAEWRVVSPELAGAIERQAFAFCQSTLNTTTLQTDAAYAAIRQELAESIIVQGEALPALTTRMQGIFEGMTESKARVIAHTESSRAHHAGMLEAARQSDGAVVGFDILLSADACPLCQAIKAGCPRAPLGQAFAIIGDNPTYSTIEYPPFHPNCACSLTEIISTNLGGPADPQWGETVVAPDGEPESKGYKGGAPVVVWFDPAAANPEIDRLLASWAAAVPSPLVLTAAQTEAARRLYADFEQLPKDAAILRRIEAVGAMAPLIVWTTDGGWVVLDGHHRLAVAAHHGLEYVLAYRGPR